MTSKPNAGPSREYVEARQALVAALQIDDNPTTPLLDYVQQAAEEIDRLNGRVAELENMLAAANSDGSAFSTAMDYLR